MTVISANSVSRTVPASTIGEIGGAPRFSASAIARGERPVFALAARPGAGAGISDIEALTCERQRMNAQAEWPRDIRKTFNNCPSRKAYLNGANCLNAGAALLRAARPSA